MRAGVLAFLTGMHGCIARAGSSAAFLPLGMTVLLGLTAWRAGSALADAVEYCGDRDLAWLALVGAAQTGSFTISCLIGVPLATLGTSDAPFLGVGFFATIV